jgi:hypothetical protein
LPGLYHPDRNGDLPAYFSNHLPPVEPHKKGEFPSLSPLPIEEIISNVLPFCHNIILIGVLIGFALEYNLRRCKYSELVNIFEGKNGS